MEADELNGPVIITTAPGVWLAALPRDTDALSGDATGRMVGLRAPALRWGFSGVSA